MAAFRVICGASDLANEEAERAARQRFSDEAERALRRVLAKEPIALCVIAETADGVEFAAVPAAECVIRGLALAASAAMEPQSGDEAA